jgi:hypothetical protein
MEEAMSQGARHEVGRTPEGNRRNEYIGGTNGTEPDVTLFDDGDLSSERAPEESSLGRVMRAPAVGASITGALVLGAAAAFGVLEAAVAAGAAYATYVVLRKKASRPSSP